MYCIDHEAYETLLQMCPSNFKKFHIEDNFLSKRECIMLSEYIKYHKLLSRSSLNPDNFGSTYSFQIYFNKYSKNDFLNSPYNLKPIYDIFERIKQPGTNAYVFNPIVLDGLRVFEKNTNKIRYHYDDTLDLSDNMGKLYLPVCVTILYIQVPEKFIGGTLKMHDFGYLECHNLGIIEIRPEVGKKVVFRGDMHHGVSSLYCSKDTKRISLVFEQYNIPENRLNEVNFRVER